MKYLEFSSLIPVVALVVLLAGCDNGPTLDCGVDATAPDTSIGAMVNERPFVMSGLDEGGYFLVDTSSIGLLYVIGARMCAGSREAIQVTLYGFDGVGMYVLDGDWAPHSGSGIYDRRGNSWWSDGEPADTAWVTMYDGASGQIEGTFGFVGRRAVDDSVVVRSGVFRGVVTAFSPPPSGTPRRTPAYLLGAHGAPLPIP